MLRRLLYRLANRLIVLDITHLLVVDRPLRFQGDEYMFQSLNRERFEYHCSNPELQMDPEMAERLDGALDFCFAAFDEDRLIGYCWVALNSIEAEHNRGSKHPESGVAISFPVDTAFIYKAFTHSDYRGRRVFPQVLGFASRVLRDQGIGRIVSTTDWSNQPAVRAFTRCGFRSLGHIWKLFRFNLRITRAPGMASEFGLRFGRTARVVAR